MQHEHNVHDSDARFSISPTTRLIKNDSNRKTTIMQEDHNSERFTFELPRHIEGHDMSLCNEVEVHYLNASAKDKSEFNKGRYTVTDLQISPEDEEKVVFSWLISANATQLVGSLSFRIRFKCVEDGAITYAWHTAIYTDVSVSAGINADETFELDYVDIIEQWKEALKIDINHWHDDAVSEMREEISAWKETESGKVRGEMTAFSAQWNQALSAERARIDQFTSLPEGSTAGDAELMDIRVGADGVTYESAGTAVREQIDKLSSNAVSDFVEHGGADKYISNIEIYTDEYEHLMISDIRNGYTGSVGFSLFSCDANGENFETIRAVHELPQSQKRVQVTFGENSILIVDFDVSGMEVESRYTDVGLKSKVKPTNIFSRSVYNEINRVESRFEALATNASISLFETMGVIGDSFASGEVYIKQSDGNYTGKDYYRLSWGQIIARSQGMTCENYSAGGLTTRTWLTSNRGLSLLKANNPQQLYVFALGINDTYKLGLDYLGTVNDIKADYKDNPDTFFGNYGRIIDQVKEHAPNSKLILSTMAETRWNCGAFNEAIEQIANHYGVPCVKQYEDEFFNSAFYKDHQVQGHPISVVYSGMAKAITRLIEKAMVVNYGYFTEYIG